MLDPATSTNDSFHHRRWLLLGFVVAAHAALNLLFGTRNGQDRGLMVLAMGITFSQPIIFGCWAAIGPPPAAKRIPLTIAAFVTIVLAGAISNNEWLSPQFLVVTLGSFSIATIGMLVVGKLASWSISNVHQDTSHNRLNQFSVKYLLVLTSICAVLLGVGRELALRQTSNPSLPSGNFVLELVTMTGLIMLATLPALIGPLMVLSRRPKPTVLIAIPFIWAGLTALAVETIVALENPPRAEIVRDVLLIQAGAAAAGLCSALVLRLAGYRLLRSGKSTVSS